MKILIAGATGLIGSKLVPFLKEQGHQVVILTREQGQLDSGSISWNPESGFIDGSKLEGFDAIINLAGENIADGRWTEEKKEKIYKSRVNLTRQLSEAIANLTKPPKVFINASATGYYGNKWDIIQTEDSPRGVGFLADLCLKWEEATQVAEDRGIRVVKLRTGIVLSPQGGALGKMIPPFKMGMGGTLGGGAQYMSWITLEDLIRVIDFALTHDSIKGPINVVTPNPVSNADFTKALGKQLHRPTFMHMPEMVVKVMFGEMADEMLLSSTRAMPEKLTNAGFKFEYPMLEEALQHVLGANESLSKKQ